MSTKKPLPKNSKLKNAIKAKGRTLILNKQQYTNGNLAVELLCTDGEPWSTLTVNLGMRVPENMAFVDSNNNSEEIIEACKKAGYIKPTGILSASGFCMYECYEICLED